MKPARIPLAATALGLYAFLYLPIAVVVVFSFNAARYNPAWEGFSLQWYAALLDNRAAQAAVRNTLILALSSTAVATVLGTLLGFGLSRYRFPGRNWVAQSLQVPVFIPDIVMAAALLLGFSLAREWTGRPQLGLTTMVLAHVSFQIPFVAVVVRARLAGLDPALEEAARDLGANSAQAFRHVTLPLILPGVLAAAMLALTLSLDDFVVSFFTSGPGSTTLPILIYSSVKRGLTPEINALATLMVVAAVLVAAVLSLYRRGADRA
ncbi:MAG: ABC transporter permease [Verrucomicrobia bacterium]|nr:ABC transporter permease [Verrucomicrobiota bacterium]